MGVQKPILGRLLRRCQSQAGSRGSTPALRGNSVSAGWRRGAPIRDAGGSASSENSALTVLSLGRAGTAVASSCPASRGAPHCFPTRAQGSPVLGPRLPYTRTTRGPPKTGPPKLLVPTRCVSPCQNARSRRLAVIHLFWVRDAVTPSMQKCRAPPGAGHV